MARVLGLVIRRFTGVAIRFVTQTDDGKIARQLESATVSPWRHLRIGSMIFYTGTVTNNLEVGTKYSHYPGPGRTINGTALARRTCKLHRRDATVNHMRKASVRDLRYSFKKIERLLHEGEEIQITKRRRVIARLIPESVRSATHMPDFQARLRSIYGEKSLQVSGAELIAQDRIRY